MSYNPSPKWADVKLHGQFANLRCPDCNAWLCGTINGAFGEVQTAGYYTPAHIPPRLLLTCPVCEIDISIELSVIVYNTGKPRKEN